MAEQFEPKFKRTSRAFRRYEFADLYGKASTLQESSLASDYAIWLGVDEGTHHVTGDCMGWMHLNREQALWLIERLQHFVDTGYLPEPATRPASRAEG